METKPGTRSGYHHGDLRNALIAAAVDLASQGGPERVVLREVARRVGVSPTAAYRHFDGQADLMYEVKTRGQVALADCLERAAAEVPGTDDPGVTAALRFTAMGRGYIHFAMESPGLFRSAFCHFPGGPDGDWAGTAPGGSGAEYRAFNLLTAALDELAAHGRLAAHRRGSAEVTAWSAVHGLSLLILEGPLARLPDEQREALIEGALETMLAGFTAP